MHSVYNDTVTAWSLASMNASDFEECVSTYYENCPERFSHTSTPFTVCDFGCTNGGSSVLPLKAIIQDVRKYSPDMPIQIYLNDLPECRFDLTFKTVSEALRDFSNIYLMAVGKDFTK